MSDLNTTASEGRACRLCGEDATGVTPRIETPEGPIFDVPLCTACWHDGITECPRCEQVIFQTDGHRTFTSPDLFCASCHGEMVAAIASAALDQDIARDDAPPSDFMERIRR